MTASHRSRFALLALALSIGNACAVAVTRTADAVQCSSIINSAVADREGNSLHGQASALQALATLLKLSKSESVKHFPVAAVLGGATLFDSDSADSEKINLSPAIETGSEVCFFAMASTGDGNFQTTCKPVCTDLQSGTVSLAFHQTDLSDTPLPFLFIGHDAQEFAECDEIVYPDFRTAAGWMCRADISTTAKSSDTGVLSTGIIAAIAGVSAAFLIVIVGAVVVRYVRRSKGQDVAHIERINTETALTGQL